MQKFLTWLNENQGFLAFIAIIISIFALSVSPDTLKKLNQLWINVSQQDRRKRERFHLNYISNLKNFLNSFPWWGNSEDKNSLRRYFVPLALTSTTHPESKMRVIEKDSNISSIEDILSDKSKRRVVLLGEPGSGKTTLLRNTALRLLEQTNDNLPVFIRIKNWINKLGNNSLWDELNYQLGTSNAGMESDAKINQSIKKKLKNGKFLFFLDGLDEVGEESYQQAVDAINESFRHKYFMNCRFIISCRTQIYKPASINADIVIETREFEEDDIFDFLDRFDWTKFEGKSSRGLFLLLKSKEYLIDNCRNPLRLSIVVSLYRMKSDLPESERELYDEFCRVLTSSRKITWQNKKLKGAIVYEVLKPIFEDLAFSMYSTQKNFSEYTHFRVTDLKKIILNNYQLKKEKLIAESPVVAVAELANEILRRSSLISIRAKNQYEFSHLTFQEFFAAERIDRESDKIERIVNYIAEDRTKWLHPLLYRWLRNKRTRQDKNC